MIERARERRWRLVTARSDAVPASVRRFTARARHRRWRTARPWLIAAGVALLVGVLATVVLATPLLGVDRVVVTGAVSVPADEIRRVAGVGRGTPLARVDTDVVARRIRSLAPVRDVRITRDWPGTLVLAVVERTAAAAVARGDGYLLVDPDGVGYAEVAYRPDGVTLVELAHPGPDDPSTRAALTVVAALPDALRVQVLLLRAEAPARIRLELPGGRTVVWGDSSDNAAKAKAALALLDQPGTVIDVSAPDVVTIR